MIYFILHQQENSIKIGHTKSPGSLQKRLKTFKCGNPGDLVVLHTQRGDRIVEARIHRQFANLRRDGEWFWHAGSLARYLSQAAAIENF